jgi:hypothetical protein
VIATRRGLAVLAALAVALLLAALLAGPRQHGPVDRSLVPGIAADQVTELVFARGGVAIRIARSGGTWRWQDPPGLAEPAAIDAALTALRGGRWHRRADAAVAGTPRAQLTVEGTTLGIGRELPGTGQTWLVRGRDALLVDSWIASALAPEPLALRLRHPLACAAAASTPITASTAAGTLRIEGARIVPRGLWLDDQWLASLADACAAVEIVALGPGQRTAAGLHVAATGELTEVGTCEGGRILVDTSAGAGCVERAVLDRLRALVDHAIREPDDAIERRPLPFDPIALTLQDAKRLELSGTPRIDLDDADPARVRELVAALRAKGTVVPRPKTDPRVTIQATARDGTRVTLDLYDHVIARATEPSAIQIAPEAWATIVRPTATLRDPTLWREDPTTISSLTLDGVTYARGAVLGEWTRTPAGKVDPALVDALVESLAIVRAPAGAAPTSIAHRLAVTITPPAGPPLAHALELAAPGEAGCAARVDGAPVVLPLPLCTAVLALAASR